MPALSLSGRQRKELRARAHPKKAIVQIGQSGITEALVQAVDQALQDHELVKVQMRQPQDKRAMAQTLADATSAALCGLVGHTVILYRPRPPQ